MSEITQKLAQFPGFAACYDPAQKPFFEKNLLADLEKIASKPVGKSLLQQIADADPKNRAPAANIEDIKGMVFPGSINVMCVPTSMTFVQSGLKRDGQYIGTKFVTMGLVPSDAKSYNPAGCRFYGIGGSYAMAADPMYATKNGTVSVMYYTNAQVFSQGAGVREETYSFIVLAHELIHSLHHLTGTTLESTCTFNGKQAKNEELRTSGLGSYKDEPLSENKFRAAFGLKARLSY